MFPFIALWVVLFTYMESIAEGASRINYALLLLVFLEKRPMLASRVKFGLFI